MSNAGSGRRIGVLGLVDWQQVSCHPRLAGTPSSRPLPHTCLNRWESARPARARRSLRRVSIARRHTCHLLPTADPLMLFATREIAAAFCRDSGPWCGMLRGCRGATAHLHRRSRPLLQHPSASSSTSDDDIEGRPQTGDCMCLVRERSERNLSGAQCFALEEDSLRAHSS